MKLEEELNKIENGKYNFALKSAVLDSGAEICYLEFFYNDGTLITPAVKSECEAAVKKFLPQGFEYNLKFIKNFVDKENIASYVESYFKKNHVSLQVKVSFSNSGNTNLINLVFDQVYKDFVLSEHVVENLKANLQEHFDMPFVVATSFVDGEVDFSIKEDDEPIIEVPKPKYIEVTNREVVVGEEITENATYIRDTKKEIQNAVLCGYIKNISRAYTKPKIAEGEDAQKVMAHFRDSSIPEEERLNAGQKRIYRFVLEDFTGEISGVFFPKKGEEDLLEKVAENSTVIVCGDIKDVSLFGISIRIKSLSFCTLPDEWEEKIDYKKEKSYYEYVFPEDMVYTDQVGLFSLGGEPEVAPYLKQHDIVVFDFETTGKYPYGGDKIIEIGAVKVINGAITQKFHTLVDPKMHIPEESTLIHHLTDADVAGAITADKALQDFYKFTRGCVLSGYNIVGFDCHFLNIEGKQSRYNFDNPVIDVYPLAQRNVKGIKNYKLGTVSKALGVTLDNAHSALYDTIATAEVLIKLAKYI